MMEKDGKTCLSANKNNFDQANGVKSTRSLVEIHHTWVNVINLSSSRGSIMVMSVVPLVCQLGGPRFTNCCFHSSFINIWMIYFNVNFHSYIGRYLTNYRWTIWLMKRNTFRIIIKCCQLIWAYTFCESYQL